MSYQDEYQDVLQRIANDNPDIRGLSYFMDTARQWHTAFADEVPSLGFRSTPRVVVLGYGIPEQLIYACGATPCHLLGGSHASCAWSDDVMPRDADPVSRSILGYALRLAGRSVAAPLFVVPTTNDSMRKTAYLLKREGHDVLPIDVPPVGASISDQRAWERSLRGLIEGVGRHVGMRATARRLRKANELVGAAKAAMVEFECTCVACDGLLSDEAMLLVLTSYYQTERLAEWTQALDALTKEVATRYDEVGWSIDGAPHVLVIGSPIVFPQYKVPALIHDAGLRVAAAVDAASTARFVELSAQERRGSAVRITSALARKHYSLDSSSAHVVNRSLEQYVEHLLSTRRVDGVICHILKGQIEYDFELARMEPLFERLDIPVFRLETDYQYQDVEQLRIRLEAFAEMLEQRAFVASQASMRMRCA